MKKTKIKLGSLLGFLAGFAIVCSFTVALAKNPVEIEIWHRWYGGHNELMQEIIDNFHAKHPGITVKNVSVPGEYVDLETKVLARFAAGEEPPSILVPGYFLILHTVVTFNPAKIDEVAGAEARAVYDQYLPATLELGQVDGEQWGLPFALSNQVLYYNPKVFEKSGLDPKDPPKMWREANLVGKTIKDKTKVSPLYIANPDTWLMATLIESNGGRMLKNGRAAFDSPEGIEVMEMWRKFYKEGLIPKVSPREGPEGFLAGRIAMLAGSITYLRHFVEKMPFVEVGHLPAFGYKPTRHQAGGAALAITAKDPEKRKAAWELMKYMVSKESLNIWVRTGYISPLDPAKVKIPLADRRQQPAYDQLPRTVKWVNWPGPHGLEIEKILMDWRDKILYGEVGAEEGLHKVAKLVNDLLR
jgi:multiple sugar transport system substrate-binding protein